MRPISGVRPTAARAPPVAIIAFDGMQSQRCAAPPITSSSMTVTSAPRRAAWLAAVLPAGPPPMITKRSATARGYRSASRAGHGRPAATATVEQVVPRTVLSRATEAVANRLDRRSFIGRSALVGSALVTAPTDLLLRPTSAYAAVCSCLGKSCDCGSLCCDGYTEFCCALYGANHAQRAR